MWKNGSVSQRIDQGVLRWFGHVERIGDERMAKRVYEYDVRGVRRRGRPRKCWMDGVKEVLARKGLDIQEVKASIHMQYIDTYIHTYIHTCIHTNIHACMHTYMHTYLHTYILHPLFLKIRVKRKRVRLLLIRR